MFISIIIPHYKNFGGLLLVLRSMESQTLPSDNWEVIVVNNDPDLPLLLPEGLSLRYSLTVFEEPNPGSYAARNKGIAAAKGNIVAFTDSDCLPDIEWLKHAWEVFSLDFKKEIGILTGPVSIFFKDPTKLSDAEVYEKYTGFTTKVYASEGHAITANWFSYKSVMDEFGRFNSTLKSNGDSELSGKINTKYPIVYRENILVKHPARYRTEDLVNKYRRLLGGTFTRKYQRTPKKFKWHILDFIVRRYRFAVKRFLSVSPKESLAIWRVCHSINKGAVKEYFDLRSGVETKR
ncbi:glycosyltransferase family 2 protein [Algoriphagus aestuariicola]|uniref:Glycosyltransferase family 2 protein n=1 Tax=Algoriphagus aestuariicola TaxID=1852016 RepID=A0ABS3BLL1_9BACT|nr:glycosyltransferase family A protein [Algoriphagus aestuariicola]MBN7800186.1 glycosyltransferase family 2 protein [Algoriphagus aestuariicola]